MSFCAFMLLVHLALRSYSDFANTVLIDPALESEVVSHTIAVHVLRTEAHSNVSFNFSKSTGTPKAMC